MPAGSLLGSVLRSLTARVEMRAVAVCEICFCRLEARMKAFSHLYSLRRSMTARVILEAVVSSEISFCRLKARFEGFQSSLFHAVLHDCPGVEVGSRCLGNDLLSTDGRNLIYENHTVVEHQTQ